METTTEFKPITLTSSALCVWICRVDKTIRVDLRSACELLKFNWKEVEFSLAVTADFWHTQPAQHNVKETLLMPATLFERWLQHPQGANTHQGRAAKLSRVELVAAWAHAYPRQMMLAFPDSTDARSLASKLARASRTGAITDPELAEGMKAAFLTIRQNRTPGKKKVFSLSNRIGRTEVTPQMVRDLYDHYITTGSFEKANRVVHLSPQTFGLLITGQFKNPTPELLAAYDQTFGPRFKLKPQITPL